MRHPSLPTCLSRFLVWAHSFGGRFFRGFSDNLEFKVLVQFAAGLAVLAAGTPVTAYADVSIEEKTALRDQIMEHQGRVQNMRVDFLLETKQIKEGLQSFRRWTYATSAEKRYVSFGESVQEPQKASADWAIGVWDGRAVKTYNKELNTGHIFPKPFPLEPGQLSFGNDFARLQGTFEGESIQDLLKRVPLEDWQLEWVRPGECAVLSTTNLGEGLKHAWTVDLKRGCLITQNDTFVPTEPGKYELFVRTTLTNAEEVQPGLWMPNKAASEAYENGESVSINLLTTESVKVNDPSVEDLFKFEFPQGSKYFDHILNGSVFVGDIKVVSKAVLAALVLLSVGVTFFLLKGKLQRAAGERRTE